MDAIVYNQEGKKTGKVELPVELFGAPWKADLVHQVAVSMQSNARHSNAHTKDRSEVRGGGKKPWRQKGTGRARHGSSRSPIWVGGGVTHGPRNEKNYIKLIPRRMKGVALVSLLSKKFKEGEIAFVDSLSLKGKTKEAREVFLALSGVEGFDTLKGKKKNALLLVVPEKTAVLARAFQNFGNVELTDIQNMNLLSLLAYRFIAFVEPKEALSLIEKRVEAPKRTKNVK